MFSFGKVYNSNLSKMALHSLHRYPHDSRHDVLRSMAILKLESSHLSEFLKLFRRLPMHSLSFSFCCSVRSIIKLTKPWDFYQRRFPWAAMAINGAVDCTTKTSAGNVCQLTTGDLIPDSSGSPSQAVIGSHPTKACSR